MSRRKGRELAVQTLFSLDFNKISWNEAFQNILLMGEEKDDKSVEFFGSLLKGTMENIDAIDNLIKNISMNWKIERIAYLEKNVTRLAVYELYFSDNDLPEKVIINEAIEIAKHFAGKEAGKFVNGILSSIIDAKNKNTIPEQKD